MGEIVVQVVPNARVAGELGPRSAITERLMDRIDEVGDAVMELARSLQARIAEGAADAPGPMQLSEVSLTFSMDLEAGAGVVVSRASAHAGFEVGLTWSRG